MLTQAFWEFEQLRAEIHIRNNFGLRRIRSRQLSVPDIVFDSLQWLQLPHVDDQSEVDFRFRINGQDTYNFVAKGSLQIVGSSRNHLRRISFVKEYLGDDMAQWQYNGFILPNGVVLGRWRDSVDNPEHAVEGPFIFFPAKESESVSLFSPEGSSSTELESLEGSETGF